MKHSRVLYFLLMLTILWAVMLNGQAPDTLWTKTYGGEFDDEGKSVQQTSDGGFIIAGFTESFGAGDMDFFLIRTDADGDTLWLRTYGGIDPDWGSSVQETSDGGFIITGQTWSFCFGFGDVYLIKTDANGDTLWTKTYGWAGAEAGMSVMETSDYGFIIAGWTDVFGASGPDVYLIKTDSIGDTIWSRVMQDTAYEIGYSVQETSDNCYIVSGWTTSFGDEGIYLIKINAEGATLWKKTHSGDWGFSVQETSDSGYIITGSVWDGPGGGYENVYLIKTDIDGDTLWTRRYGGAKMDLGYSVQETSDYGYIITGYTESFGAGSLDVYLIKTDILGDTLWTKTYGGPNYDLGYSVQETFDGGYIISGVTYSFGQGKADVYLIKTGPDPTGIEENETSSLKPRLANIKIFPNPFTAMTSVEYSGIIEGQKVSLQVYDVSGRLVKSILLTTGHLTLGADLSPGIYFLKVDGKYVGKVVKVR